MENCHSQRENAKQRSKNARQGESDLNLQTMNHYNMYDSTK
jgi:hypothetical protein